MAATIRLQRHGTRNRPFYHLVAAHQRKSATKQCIEKLGYYDPGKNPSIIEVNSERVQYWYGKGAILSNTAKVILQAKNVKLEREKTAPAQAKKPAKKK